jgi:hypothetical protein
LLIFLIEMIKDIILQILPLIGDNYDKHSYMAQSAQMWRDTEDWRRATWEYHGLTLRPYEIHIVNRWGNIGYSIKLKIPSDEYNMRLMYICAHFKPNSVIVVNNKLIGGWKRFLLSLNTANLTVFDAKAPENSQISLKPEDKDKIRLLNKKQYDSTKKEPANCVIMDEYNNTDYKQSVFLIGQGEHGYGLEQYKLAKISCGFKPNIKTQQIASTPDISAQIYNMGKSYIVSDIPLNYPVLTIKDELDDAFSVVDSDYMLRNIIHHNNIVFIGENYEEFKNRLSSMRFSSRKIIYFNVISIDKIKCFKLRVSKLMNVYDEIIPVIRLLLMAGIEFDTLTDDDIYAIFGYETDGDETCSKFEYKNIMRAKSL